MEGSVQISACQRVRFTHREAETGMNRSAHSPRELEQNPPEEQLRGADSRCWRQRGAPSRGLSTWPHLTHQPQSGQLSFLQVHQINTFLTRRPPPSISVSTPGLQQGLSTVPPSCMSRFSLENPIHSRQSHALNTVSSLLVPPPPSPRFL